YRQQSVLVEVLGDVGHLLQAQHSQNAHDQGQQRAGAEGDHQLLHECEVEIPLHECAPGKARRNQACSTRRGVASRELMSRISATRPSPRMVEPPRPGTLRNMGLSGLITACSSPAKRSTTMPVRCWPCCTTTRHSRAVVSRGSSKSSARRT